MHLETVGPYYSPSGESRKKKKKEIRDAIEVNPSQDPCVTIEGSVLQTGSPHLDLAIVLIEMVQDKEIARQTEGWCIASSTITSSEA